MTAPRPYQVCLYVGPQVPSLPGVRVVDLTPQEPTAEAVLAQLHKSELTPPDLRSRVLFVADGASAEERDAALLVYAALLGFAKRRLDVAFGIDATAHVVADFDSALRRQADAGRGEAILQAQVGGPARDDLPHVDITNGFTPESVSVIRYARRLRFVPPEQLEFALFQLVAVAALRARGNTDKLPFLCDGTEPAPAEGGSSAVVGICLDTLRRDAEEIRRSLRSDNRDALADPIPVSARRQRLLDADAVDLPSVLLALGATSKIVELEPREGTAENEAGEKLTQEVWHCPRPDRHTNGDANPSARINAKTGGFQCFRCHPERLGPLRLVMDVKECSADEAADWLLSC